jgi:hypothetical protein
MSQPRRKVSKALLACSAALIVAVPLAAVVVAFAGWCVGHALGSGFGLGPETAWGRSLGQIGGTLGALIGPVAVILASLRRRNQPGQATTRSPVADQPGDAP